MLPNKAEFSKLCTEIEKYNHKLNFVDLGRIFGDDFWQLLILSLIDAKYSMLPPEINKARKKLGI